MIEGLRTGELSNMQQAIDLLTSLLNGPRGIKRRLTQLEANLSTQTTWVSAVQINLRLLRISSCGMIKRFIFSIKSLYLTSFTLSINITSGLTRNYRRFC
jgi:hypothetical protein